MHDVPETVGGAGAVSDNGEYRRGVGVMLLNSQGKVWVGARIDNSADAWQMPQGGIDEGEHDPWLAALREVEEETGIPPHLVERIATCPERLKYRLPDELIGVIWKEHWVGQEQDWFLVRFLGHDRDINIETAHPEFREWRWIDPQHLPDVIVPFKRDLYHRLLSEFADQL